MTWFAKHDMIWHEWHDLTRITWFDMNNMILGTEMWKECPHSPDLGMKAEGTKGASSCFLGNEKRKKSGKGVGDNDVRQKQLHSINWAF
jgi:hypothetical protein